MSGCWFVVVVIVMSGLAIGYGKMQEWWLTRSIGPSLVVVTTVSHQQLLGVVTEKGACIVNGDSEDEMDIASISENKTSKARIVSRKPFPICWIVSETLPSAPVKVTSFRRWSEPRKVKLFQLVNGKIVVESADLGSDGYLSRIRNTLPSSRGLAALGPVFDLHGNCVGYGFRQSEGEAAKVAELRRE